MINKGMFTSLKSNWRTPKKFYEELNKEFLFDFDPCPENPSFDGLKIEWGFTKFVNPPYGTMIKEWIYKGINENKKGKTVVFLIPARTDTTWFQALLDLGNVEFRFIKGRLHFDDSKNPAPFPSVISILMGSQS